MTIILRGFTQHDDDMNYRPLDALKARAGRYPANGAGPGLNRSPNAFDLRSIVTLREVSILANGARQIKTAAQ